MGKVLPVSLACNKLFDVTAACPSLRQHPLLAGSHLDACADSLLLTTPQQFDWMAGRCAFGVCETGVTMEGRD